MHPSASAPCALVAAGSGPPPSLPFQTFDATRSCRLKQRAAEAAERAESAIADALLHMAPLGAESGDGLMIGESANTTASTAGNATAGTSKSTAAALLEVSSYRRRLAGAVAL